MPRCLDTSAELDRYLGVAGIMCSRSAYACRTNERKMLVEQMLYLLHSEDASALQVNVESMG